MGARRTAWREGACRANVWTWVGVWTGVEAGNSGVGLESQHWAEAEAGGFLGLAAPPSSQSVRALGSVRCRDLLSEPKVESGCERYWCWLLHPPHVCMDTTSRTQSTSIFKSVILQNDFCWFWKTKLCGNLSRAAASSKDDKCPKLMEPCSAKRVSVHP